MRVLVTGGTGFLGGHIVRELTAAGHEPIVFARASSDTARLEAEGVEIRRGAFDDRRSLEIATSGVDAVVHAAGGGIVREVADYYRGNTESTVALLASLPTMTKEFVLISSLAAHGPATTRREGFDSPVAFVGDPDKPSSHYGISKKQAEEACDDATLRCTILRPPALYGAGEYRMVPLFRLARHGVVPIVHPRGTLSLLSGRDCARAAVAALGGQHEAGVYYVAEPRPIRRSAMAQAIAGFAGHSRVLAIPPLIVQGAARISESVASIRGITAMFNRDKAADMCAPHQSCDPAHAESALSWKAMDRFEELAPQIGRAYEAKGWL